jgi:hypothetical protein
METQRPLIVTGQQIGAGWTPALSVVKALFALVSAQRLRGDAVYWLADEDHDQIEVARTMGYDGERILRHQFRFKAREGTATGWLPWDEAQQWEGEILWGELPEPIEPTLRGHVLSLGAPLWARGLFSFSPTTREHRDPIQAQLERWRSLPLQNLLLAQADQLEAEGETLVLDPHQQSAWFSLDPKSGMRKRLEEGEACPPDHWLSPGAALRPLMQSLMLPVTHVVLGPSERAYWRLTEPLWEVVGLAPPVILPRPSVYVVPKGIPLVPAQLNAIRHGFWETLSGTHHDDLPTHTMDLLRPNPEWGPELAQRYLQTLSWTRRKLQKLDRRLHRKRSEELLGIDPELLRQRLFPLGKPQERVLAGILWLRDEALLDRIMDALNFPGDIVLVEES